MIDITYIVSFIPILAIPFVLILSVKSCHVPLDRGLFFLTVVWVATLFSIAPIIIIMASIEAYCRIEILPWIFGLETLPIWHKLILDLSPTDRIMILSSLLILGLASTTLGSLIASRVLDLGWRKGIELTILFGIMFLLFTSIPSLILSTIWGK